MAEIIMLPVRHHSVICSKHVYNEIRKIKPDIILVEGPENANNLISSIQSTATKPPFAIYYSYNDKDGIISEEKQQYKCYYPFVDYSPEYAAIKIAEEMDIPAYFIDLPYAEILFHNRRRYEEEEELGDINDEYLLIRNKYMIELCEKSNMRSFEEFWEKYFEINGIDQDSETWFSNLRLYCDIARAHTSPESLQEDGTVVREQFMAQEICRYVNKGDYSKIVVITGGFHTSEIADTLRKACNGNVDVIVPARFSALSCDILEGKSTFSELSKKEKEADSIPETSKYLPDLKYVGKSNLENQNVFIMPYSMEAIDSRNGYASGLSYPGFYQMVWEAGFEETLKNYVVNLGKKLRNKYGNLSTDDEIQAVYLAKELANLREKKYPGVYELKDAVLSAFVKGEVNGANDYPLDMLEKELIGNQIGELSGEELVPPLVEDFHECCRKLKIQTQNTDTKKMVLNLFEKENHRKIGQFFHKLEFLEIPFANLIKGPRLFKNTGLNLVREIWEYKWKGAVFAALVDISVFGQTIDGAVEQKIWNFFRKEQGAVETARILTQIFSMGYTKHADKLYTLLKNQIRNEQDYFKVYKALKYIDTMKVQKELYNCELDMEMLVQICVEKLLQLLPFMKQIADNQLQELLSSLKGLYHIFQNQENYGDLESEKITFLEIIKDMVENNITEPGIQGCSAGILYGISELDLDVIKMQVRGFLNGTQLQNSKLPDYLRGLFYTARDLVFVDHEFVKCIDEYLMKIDSEKFKERIPNLKLAFNYFTPGEIGKIAKIVMEYHGRNEKSLFDREIVTEEMYRYGKSLDEFCMQE